MESKKDDVFEPSAEVKLMMERVRYINENIDKMISKGYHKTVSRWTRERKELCHEIRLAWAAWRYKDSPKSVGKVRRQKRKAEICHYFKYGSINHHQAALNCSEDPRIYSLEYGKPGLVWECYHALPDKYRLSERDMLRKYHLFPDKAPAQDVLRQWIKGKRMDDPQCSQFVAEYIMNHTEDCCVRGLYMEPGLEYLEVIDLRF